jgi:hypothetical protein
MPGSARPAGPESAAFTIPEKAGQPRNRKKGNGVGLITGTLGLLAASPLPAGRCQGSTSREAHGHAMRQPYQRDRWTGQVAGVQDEQPGGVACDVGGGFPAVTACRPLSRSSRVRARSSRCRAIIAVFVLQLRYACRRASRTA